MDTINNEFITEYNLQKINEAIAALDINYISNYQSEIKALIARLQRFII
jgi:hypothetical protein